MRNCKNCWMEAGEALDTLVTSVRNAKVKIREPSILFQLAL